MHRLSMGFAKVFPQVHLQLSTRRNFVIDVHRIHKTTKILWIWLTDVGQWLYNYFMYAIMNFHLGSQSAIQHHLDVHNKNTTFSIWKNRANTKKLCYRMSLDHKENHLNPIYPYYPKAQSTGLWNYCRMNNSIL